MESKVIQALHLYRDLHSYALFRQLSIDANRFEDAMTNHFLFKSYLSDYSELKDSMTQAERNHFMMALTCLDYSNLYK